MLDDGQGSEMMEMRRQGDRMMDSRSDGGQRGRMGHGGLKGGMTPGPCPEQMWTSAPRTQAYVVEVSVRTCPALSAAFARLASGAQRVRRMWMSVLKSHHPVGQAAATTRLAPFTVPALLASAPEGQGPPAKVRVLSPTGLHHRSLWGLERDIVGGQGGRMRGLMMGDRGRVMGY